MTLKGLIITIIFVNSRNYQKYFATSKHIIEECIKSYDESKDFYISTKKLAKNLDISEGTIFFHFKDKEALIKSCLETSLKTIFDFDISTCKNNNEKLVTIIKHLLQRIEKKDKEVFFVKSYFESFPNISFPNNYLKFKEILFSLYILNAPTIFKEIEFDIFFKYLFFSYLSLVEKKTETSTSISVFLNIFIKPLVKDYPLEIGFSDIININ